MGQTWEDTLPRSRHCLPTLCRMNKLFPCDLVVDADVDGWMDEEAAEVRFVLPAEMQREDYAVAE